MQLKKAAELKRERGDKPCDHSNLEKEYDLGSATGDYVCTQCGEAGFGSDWPERERLKQARRTSAQQ
jgi:hypothetical protein